MYADDLLVSIYFSGPALYPTFNSLPWYVFTPILLICIWKKYPELSWDRVPFGTRTGNPKNELMTLQTLN